MNSEIEFLRSRGLPDFLADRASLFLETGDPSIPRNITSFPSDWQTRFVGASLVSEIAWSDQSAKLLRFFIHLSDGAGPTDDDFHQFIYSALRHLFDADFKGDSEIVFLVANEIENHHRDLKSYVNWHLGQYAYRDDWRLKNIVDNEAPFLSPVANLFYRNLDDSLIQNPEVLTQHDGLFSAIAVHRKKLTEAWAAQSAKFNPWKVMPAWAAILDATSDYDDLCLSFCETLSATDAHNAFSVMQNMVNKREGKHLDKLIEIASLPQAALCHEGLDILFQHRENDVLAIMGRAFALSDAGQYTSMIDGPGYARLFKLMIADFDQGGREVFQNMIANFNGYKFADLMTKLLPPLASEHFVALREGFHRRIERTEARERAELWKVVAQSHPGAFLTDFEEMLEGKSKPLREIAATALAKLRGSEALPGAYDLLGSPKADARLGAVALIERVADPSSLPVLRGSLENESADAVRSALHKALKACGATDDLTNQSAIHDGDFDMDAFLSANSKGIKLPSSTWLNISKLPPLHGSSGEIFPENAIALLIAKQSKQKDISAAPDILPLLAHVDREKSALFAAALVEGFLHSEQVASDRWALTLGGLLGDNRIISLLLPRIQGWCENSRHKLAEYAAQAISLLPGNEPLMVLDSLANRYRTKFKNIGSACSAAFSAAAAARGISPEELGDMVVPTFGFDADGIRRFDWEGGGISAELGVDFKIGLFDPETEKSWKALPANATEEVKTEVKTITKLIRETVKAQTARLEMSFVRQRQWPVARWRELFEHHPILRSFASGLIWGVYDVSGHLLRTFRRYPNGILADAAGAVEELAESDSSIAMVHPLELDQQTIDGWKAHLARMKVKQPFSQIDRSIERMDPLHANRKSVSLTDGSKLSAGTFKSRAEKRGWSRGSVVDAGAISSYYKLYPGAGVEVILPTENFWVGIDPMDEVELGAAYFAKSGTIERGGYVYDEPSPEDPRVLRFDQVPPVVFSETLADLKAIILTKNQ